MHSLPDNEDSAKQPALLVGVGLDREDDHVRLTKGENFRLVGGSEETHERMLETTLRLNEKLKQRGKELGDVEGDEFRDLLRESMD